MPRHTLAPAPASAPQAAQPNPTQRTMQISVPLHATPKQTHVAYTRKEKICRETFRGKVSCGTRLV